MPGETGKDRELTLPAGTPVRACLVIPSDRRFDFVRRALSVIDSVHNDGELPLIPVIQGSRTVGRYIPTREGGAARIEAATPSDRRVLSFAHEIGHFLDHQALGRRGSYASESGSIRSLMHVIKSSKSTKTLERRMRQASIITTDKRENRVRFKVDRKNVAYLLEPKEQFARAYAQYIAVRSRDEVMLRQLENKLGDLVTQGVYCQQWMGDDFLPIALEFDRLLHRKGWLHDHHE